MSTRRALRINTAPRRALALIRVSKERDGMTSPDVQRHAIDTWAAANGAVIVDTIEGLDESGSRAKSAWWPRLEQAISRMESGEFDTIVVWKYSRTARNRLKWAVALDRVDVVGGRIVSATEPIDGDSASGRFARGMLGEMNAYQADLIGEGWKETLDRRVRDGLPGTGRPRFGYIWERTYTPDPELVPVVREMYRQAVAGHGFASITRWLNDHGHRTRNGNPWQTINVTRYMDRGFAAGKIWSRGELYPGAHEPIIDARTWEAYLARRASTKRPPRGAVKMLSGLLRCASCGGPMMAVRTTGETGSYGCAARARGGACPAPASISRAIVEGVVSEWVRGLPERMEQLRAADAAVKARQLVKIEDRDAISRLVRRDEERLARLTVKLLDEEITQAAYDATASVVNANLEGLRERFANAAPGPESNLVTEVPTLVVGWDQHVPAAQNRILRALVDRIVVSRGRSVERVHVIARWETNK
jgi:site-specific DNA recombinase